MNRPTPRSFRYVLFWWLFFMAFLAAVIASRHADNLILQTAGNVVFGVFAGSGVTWWASYCAGRYNRK